jgi:hypothetical protein
MIKNTNTKKETKATKRSLAFPTKGEVRPQRIEIEVSERFQRLATRFDLSSKWLAGLACDLFADDPPSEIVFAGKGRVCRLNKGAIKSHQLAA